MIRSKKDLRYYLEADKIALKITRDAPPLFGSEIWRYQILLRKIEYLQENPGELFGRFLLKYYKAQYHYLGLVLGFYVSPSVFGPGLAIRHSGLLVVNNKARVGKNCCVQQGVNIGWSYGPDDVPTIGDNVFIGPGAKLFGKITIADDIAVGANAVVTRSFTEPGITIAGNPARKVSERGSRGLVVRATEILDGVRTNDV